MRHRYLSAVFLAFFFIVAEGIHFSPSGAEEFKQDARIATVKPPKPVEIELKRNDKGEYSWKLQGTDVQEVIKTDRALRSYIKGGQGAR